MADLNRRKLFGGIGASFLASLSLPTAGTAATPIPEGQERLGSILKNNDVTVIKDAIHLNLLKTYGFLLGNPFLDLAAAANVRTIGLELDQAFQPWIDAVQQAISRSDGPAALSTRKLLKEHLDAELDVTVGSEEKSKAWRQIILNGVVQAADRKIKIVAADDTRLVLPIMERVVYPELAAVRAASSESERQLHSSRLEAAAVELKSIRQGISYNKPIADKMLAEQNRRGGNLLLMFGPAHGEALQSVFSAADKTVGVLGLHASEKGFFQDEKWAETQGQTYISGDNYLIAEGAFQHDVVRGVTPRSVTKRFPQP